MFDLVKYTTSEKKPANFFGTYSKPQGAFLAHARLSTNKVNLVNTHPHSTDKWTLIHNGIVQNQGACTKFKSTCDSEYLVHYLSEGGLKSMVKNVSGYYAIGAIEHKTGKLLVVRDDQAPLFGTYIPSIDAFAIATNQKQLQEILSGMSWFVESSVTRELRSNHAWEYDINGKLLETWSITTRKFDYRDYNNDWRDKDAAKDSNVPNPKWYDSYKAKQRRKKKNKAANASQWGDMEFTDDDFNRYYIFTNGYGAKISFQAFQNLSWAERDLCVITDREQNIDVTDAFYEDHPYVD